MEDQTNNRIREEWEKVYLKSKKDSLGGNLPYKVISSEESYDWWLSKINELLKSQEHKLIEEWYTKGFKDGFSYSAEGFNGEYTHPDVNLENDLYEQIGSNLSNLIKNNG